VLLIATCVLFVGAVFVANRHVWAIFAVASLALAGLVQALTAEGASTNLAEIYAAPIYVDALAQFVRTMALVGGVVLVFVSWNEVPDRQAAEYYACLLVIIAGLSLT